MDDEQQRQYDKARAGSERIASEIRNLTRELQQALNSDVKGYVLSGDVDPAREVVKRATYDASTTEVMVGDDTAEYERADVAVLIESRTEDVDRTTRQQALQTVPDTAFVVYIRETDESGVEGHVAP